MQGCTCQMKYLSYNSLFLFYVLHDVNNNKLNLGRTLQNNLKKCSYNAPCILYISTLSKFKVLGAKHDPSETILLTQTESGGQRTDEIRDPNEKMGR